MIKVNIDGHECIFDSDIIIDSLCINMLGTDYDTPTVRYKEMGVSKKLKMKYYARVLLTAPKHLLVDHINGNTLDNRKENLRLVTSSQNSMNRTVVKNKKYGLPKGIRKQANGKYIACITSWLGIRHSLGAYDTVQEAEEIYKLAAEKYHGQYAVHISRA